MKNELKVVGILTEKMEVVTGVAKGSGKEWSKQVFLLDDGTEYDSLFAFELFGIEKVELLGKLSIGDEIEVNFNVKTREFGGKYYMSLSAWKINTLTASVPAASEVPAESGQDDLPF